MQVGDRVRVIRRAGTPSRYFDQVGHIIGRNEANTVDAPDYEWRVEMLSPAFMRKGSSTRGIRLFNSDELEVVPEAVYIIRPLEHGYGIFGPQESNLIRFRTCDALFEFIELNLMWSDKIQLIFSGGTS